MYSGRQAVFNVHPGEVDEIIPGTDILLVEVILSYRELSF